MDLINSAIFIAQILIFIKLTRYVRATNESFKSIWSNMEQIEHTQEFYHKIQEDFIGDSNDHSPDRDPVFEDLPTEAMCIGRTWYNAVDNKLWISTQHGWKRVKLDEQGESCGRRKKRA